MNYATSETFESKLFDGVRFVLRKRSVKRRAEYNNAIVAFTAKLQDLQSELGPILKQPCECKHNVGEHIMEFTDVQTVTFRCAHKDSDKACDCSDGSGPGFQPYLAKRSQIFMIDHDQMQPHRLRFFIKSVEGIELDGQPASVDSLIADGPDELLDEVDAEIKRLLELSEIERKNSESPTTSLAVVGGPTKSSTVDTAATEAGAGIAAVA